MRKIYLVLVLVICCQSLQAQKIKDFFYAEKETKQLPVLVRGDLTNNIILLFVQGGPGETAIDFARADYPGWKNTLEREVAIAYYDQRGLNQKARDIDVADITYQQYSKDLIAVAQQLRQKYDTKIYLTGHSAGGRFVLHCLSTFPKQTTFISGGILVNTPITNGYSPERYNYYRPLYLKNLAKEMIDKGIDIEKWKEAYVWIVKTDSIATPEASRKWNNYVDSAFKSKKRKIGLGMVFNVIFSRPYNPFKYLNRKDNEKVSDLLWAEEKSVNGFELLSDIQKPLLFITGRYDDIAPPEELKDAGKLVPNAQLIILPEAAHESFLDQPELFNQAVLEFVTRSHNGKD